MTVGRGSCLRRNDGRRGGTAGVWIRPSRGRPSLFSLLLLCAAGAALGAAPCCVAVALAVGRGQIEGQRAVGVVKRRAKSPNDRHPEANIIRLQRVLVKPSVKQMLRGGESAEELMRINTERIVDAIHQLARDAVFAEVPASRVGEDAEPASDGAPDVLARLIEDLLVDLCIRTSEDRFCRSEELVAGAEVGV